MEEAGGAVYVGEEGRVIAVPVADAGRFAELLFELEQHPAWDDHLEAIAIEGSTETRLFERMARQAFAHDAGAHSSA